MLTWQEWSEWYSDSAYLWIYTWRLTQVSPVLLYLAAKIYAFNVSNSIQWTKNAGNKLRGHTLRWRGVWRKSLQYNMSVPVCHTGPGLGNISMAPSSLCNVEWQFEEWKRRAPDPRHEAIDPGLVEVPLRHIIIRGLFLATIGSRWICLSLSNTSYQRTVANNLIFNDPLNHLSKRRPWCRDNRIKLWDNAELWRWRGMSGYTLLVVSETWSDTSSVLTSVSLKGWDLAG